MAVGVLVHRLYPVRLGRKTGRRPPSCGFLTEELTVAPPLCRWEVLKGFWGGRLKHGIGQPEAGGLTVSYQGWRHSGGGGGEDGRQVRGKKGMGPSGPAADNGAPACPCWGAPSYFALWG